MKTIGDYPRAIRDALDKFTWASLRDELPEAVTPEHDRKNPYIWRLQTARWQDESRMAAYRKSVMRRMIVSAAVCVILASIGAALAAVIL